MSDSSSSYSGGNIFYLSPIKPVGKYPQTLTQIAGSTSPVLYYNPKKIVFFSKATVAILGFTVLATPYQSIQGKYVGMNVYSIIELNKDDRNPLRSEWVEKGNGEGTVFNETGSLIKLLFSTTTTRTNLTILTCSYGDQTYITFNNTGKYF